MRLDFNKLMDSWIPEFGCENLTDIQIDNYINWKLGK